VSEAEVNKITALMPEDNLITDDLRELAESFGYPSLIQYCLLNMSNTFAAYVRLNNDDSISGPLAKEFTIARLLEGVPKTFGIHAAGVIVNVGNTTLSDSVPVYHTDSSDTVIGINMNNIEKYGCVKIDILNGIALDCIKSAIDYINYGTYKIYGKTSKTKGV